MLGTDAQLRTFTDGVWMSSEPMPILGMRLFSSMTVVQLPSKQLLLHSPVPLTTERREAVEALGTVAHIYAPNTFHHLSVGAWSNAFPKAIVHAPEALHRKRRDLRIDRAHDRESLGSLREVFDEVHIDGFLLEETVLLHRPSQTLLAADLVHNVGRPTHWWTKTYTSAMGFYDRVAISRMLRWTSFSDRAAARDSIDRVLSHSFDRLLIGHGTPIEHNAHDTLRSAYTWLQKTRPLLTVRSEATTSGACG